jgi:2-C-methyl-D-erythritol 2,4-cyclodiphosphate synthase
MRIGFGYDVHSMAKGVKLVLGGVDIPYCKGLQGHSDADVLVHAICDALCGSVGDGDIGTHFPDTDPEYRGISSMELLERVVTRLNTGGYSIGNVDATIVAEEPRLAPYIEEMRIRLAGTLEIEPGCISVKATTTERLGFTGRKEGIAAYAVCLVVPSKE